MEGEVLAGKYEVIRVIGAGGMGVVVEARHVQLEQRVALKFLLAEACQNEDAVGRFLREGRAAVQIKSEHVARVSDVGTLDSGSPYIVMEYLKGEDLSEVLAKRGTLTVREAVEYVLQACEAIAEAHALGIIHRDLKPANLFLTHRADGSPLIKVLDFGISKIANDPRQISLTASTGAVGSPQYMSPEQMRSAKHVDHRTDIWALGAILFELLAGRPVFEAESLIGLCTLVATKEAPRLRDCREGVPEGLEAVVSRCLRKKPEERYQDLGALAVDLMPYGGRVARTSAQRIVTVLKDAGFADTVGIPEGSESERQLPGMESGPALGQSASWTPHAPSKRQRSALLMALVGGGTGLALTIAIWAGRGSRTADAELAPDTAVSMVSTTEPRSDAAFPMGMDANVIPAPSGASEASDGGPDAPSGSASSAPSTSPSAPAGKRPRPPATGETTREEPPQPTTKDTGKLPDFGGRQY
jgi:serine/threonine-protein kinase